MGCVVRMVPGQRVVLGVRPEAVRLVSGDAADAIPATVDFIEELGAGRVTHTDLDGLPFAIAITGMPSLKMGETLGLAIDPIAIHLFSIETGQRIGSPSSTALPGSAPAMGRAMPGWRLGDKSALAWSADRPSSP
jgi:sn-glycerol 3-phosphate transport system ATP-binding protein